MTTGTAKAAQDEGANQALPLGDILFGSELNGKKFWDSWIEAKSRYQ